MMFMPNILLVGHGSVGQAIDDHIRNTLPAAIVNVYDTKLDYIPTHIHYDFIHVTIPYLNDYQYLKGLEFVWQEAEADTIIILQSTLSPLILRKLQSLPHPQTIYYIPVRVREDEMHDTIMKPIWLVAPVQYSDQAIADYLDTLHIRYEFFQDACALAYGKLMETTWSGMQIAFVQFMKQYCDKHRMDFEEAYYKYWDYSGIPVDCRKIEDLGYEPRPIFYPGIIGGKCIMQNIDNVLWPNGLLDPNLYKFIQENNENMKRILKQ